MAQVGVVECDEAGTWRVTLDLILDRVADHFGTLGRADQMKLRYEAERAADKERLRSFVALERRSA